MKVLNLNTGIALSGRYLCAAFLIWLYALGSGCGAAQSWWYGTNINEEKWNEWVECFNKAPFLSKGGISHSVFCLKGTGVKPPVLLLHELNGLTTEAFLYAEELSKDFTVYLPMLFGKKAQESMVKGTLAYWYKGFIEFFPGGEWGNRSKESAPIVGWLREVVLNMQARHQGQPIRIIGNCMTGALPLALLDNQNVDAIVVAQPALPMNVFWWYTTEDKKSLGLSDADWTMAKEKSDAKVLALRFETDWISHPEKHNTLLKGLTDPHRLPHRFIDAEICASDYQPKGQVVRAHSTLIGGRNAMGRVGELSKQRREDVRTFLLDPKKVVSVSQRGSRKFGQCAKW